MATARTQVLSNPKRLRPGVFVNSIEVDYIYFGDKRLTVYTKEGLVVSLKYNPKRRRALTDIEDDIKLLVDVPGDNVPVEPDDPTP